MKESFFCNHLSLLFTSDPPPPFQYSSWYSFLSYKHQFTEIYHFNYIIILYLLFISSLCFFLHRCLYNYLLSVNQLILHEYICVLGILWSASVYFAWFAYYAFEWVFFIDLLFSHLTFSLLLQWFTPTSTPTTTTTVSEYH